jgi:hypothetical protein
MLSPNPSADFRELKRLAESSISNLRSHNLSPLGGPKGALGLSPAKQFCKPSINV